MQEISVTPAPVSVDDQQTLLNVVDCYKRLVDHRQAAARVPSHHKELALDGSVIYLDVRVQNLPRHCMINSVTEHSHGDTTLLVYNCEDRTYLLAHSVDSGPYVFAQGYVREYEYDDRDGLPPWSVITALGSVFAEARRANTDHEE